MKKLNISIWTFAVPGLTALVKRKRDRRYI